MTISDDSLSRWNRLTVRQQRIWKHYDQVVAPQIIRAALEQKPICQLLDLYQVLAMARLNCEYNKNSFGRDSYIKFSDFATLQEESTNEPGVWNGTWGMSVACLAKDRMGNDHCDFAGLNVKLMGALWHSGGNILQKANQVFQQMVATNNFFEFIQLAARLTYDLSNFPPTIRGSSAVNTWLINIIAKEKFNAPNINPLLQDWVAFFETPEQYSSYFSISAIAKYLQNIPFIYEKDQEFFDSLSELMLKNPNTLANLEAREDIWKKMQAYIEEALSDSRIIKDQKNQLGSILNNHLIFRRPSLEIRTLVEAIKEHKPCELEPELLTQLIEHAGYTKEELHRLVQLHLHLSEIYREFYGNQSMEDKLNADWAELEILRTLPSDHFRVVTKYLAQFKLFDLEYKNIKKTDCNSIPLSYECRSIIDAYRKKSLATWEDIATTPIENLKLLAPQATDPKLMHELKARIYDAFWAGGIKLQDLSKLSLDEIKLVTNSKAIALYEKNLFIRAQDILSNPALLEQSSLSCTEFSQVHADKPPSPVEEKGDKQEKHFDFFKEKQMPTETNLKLENSSEMPKIHS